MAVRIRMKKMGRTNRPFFRVVAVDARGARDGRVLEYLGLYDPMLDDTDARATLNGARIDHWISVGAQPSDKVRVLIKKYGTNGTHAEQQKAALAKYKTPKKFTPPTPLTKFKSQDELEAEELAAEKAAAEQAAAAKAAAAEAAAAPAAEEAAPAEAQG